MTKCKSATRWPLMAVILLPAVPAFGKDWIGAADPPSPNWSEGDNWFPGSMPNHLDDVIFGISTSGGTIVDPTWASSQGLIATLTADADGLLKLGAAGGLAQTQLSTTGDLLKGSSLSLNAYKISVGQLDELDVGSWLADGTGTTATLSGVEVELLGGASQAFAAVTELIGPGRWTMFRGDLEVGGASSSTPTTFAGTIDSGVTSTITAPGESHWTIRSSLLDAKKAINLDQWDLIGHIGDAGSDVTIHDLIEARIMRLHGRRAEKLKVWVQAADNHDEVWAAELVHGARIVQSLNLRGIEPYDATHVVEGFLQGPHVLVDNAFTKEGASARFLRHGLQVKRKGSESPPASIGLSRASRFEVVGATGVDIRDEEHMFPSFEDDSSLRYGEYRHQIRVGPPPRLSTLAGPDAAIDENQFNARNQFVYTDQNKFTDACCIEEEGESESPRSYCVHVENEAHCDLLGGTYSSGVMCAATDCGQGEGCGQGPTLRFDATSYIAPAIGACCVDDACLSLSRQECAATAGCFHGDFTTCSAVDCETAPCPLGACALEIADPPTGESDTCLMLARSDCVLADGCYMGDSTECSAVDWELLPIPCKGGCCNGSECSIATRVGCELAEGCYLGDLSDCGIIGNVACPSVACCDETGCPIVNNLVLGIRDSSLDIETVLYEGPGLNWDTSLVDLVFDLEASGLPTLEVISRDVCNVLFIDAPSAEYWHDLGIREIMPRLVDCRLNQRTLTEPAEALYVFGDVVVAGIGGGEGVDLNGLRLYYSGTLVGANDLETNYINGDPIPAIITKYGDYDGDCDVDMHDFLTFQTTFGRDFDTEAHRPATDYDGDQDADLDDFDILSAAMSAYGLGEDWTDIACSVPETRPALDCPFELPCAEEEMFMMGGGGSESESESESDSQSQSESESESELEPAAWFLSVHFREVAGGPVEDLVMGETYEVHYSTDLDVAAGFVAYQVTGPSDAIGATFAQACSGSWSGATDFADTDLAAGGMTSPAVSFGAAYMRTQMAESSLTGTPAGATGHLFDVEAASDGLLHLIVYLWSSDPDELAMAEVSIDVQED